MANWCTTVFYLSGERKNAEKLQADLQRVLSIDRGEGSPLSFVPDSGWLVYVIEELLEGKTRNDYECRGNIVELDEHLTELDTDHAAVRLVTQTAWIPMTEIFKDLAMGYGLKMYYCAEELGCEILETNDEEGVFFTDRFRVDDGVDSEYYESFDKVSDVVHEITGKKPENLQELQDILEDYNDEEHTLIVQKFDIV